MINFNYVGLPREFQILEITSQAIPNLSINTTEIPQMVGIKYNNTNISSRKINIVIRSTMNAALGEFKLVDNINRWLSEGFKRECILTLDLNRTVRNIKVVVESIDYEKEGHDLIFNIIFLATEPLWFGETEKTKVYKNYIETFEFDNIGTAPTKPKIKFIATKSSENLSIVGNEGEITIGKGTSSSSAATYSSGIVNDREVDKKCDNLSGIVGNSKPVYEALCSPGLPVVRDGEFVPGGFPGGIGYHGTSSTLKGSDNVNKHYTFKSVFSIDTSNTLYGAFGSIQYEFYNTGEKVCIIRIRDDSSTDNNIIADVWFMNSQYKRHVVGNRNLGCDKIINGTLSITRHDTDFRISISDSNGRVLLDSFYKDYDRQYNNLIPKEITFSFLQFAKYETPKMAIRYFGLFKDDINIDVKPPDPDVDIDAPEVKPKPVLLINVGDVVEIDNVENVVKINDIPVLNKINLGSEFITFTPGINTVKVIPHVADNLEIEFTPRYY